jgi:hypothetical protein
LSFLSSWKKMQEWAGQTPKRSKHWGHKPVGACLRGQLESVHDPGVWTVQLLQLLPGMIPHTPSLPMPSTVDRWRRAGESASAEHGRHGRPQPQRQQSTIHPPLAKRNDSGCLLDHILQRHFHLYLSDARFFRFVIHTSTG